MGEMFVMALDSLDLKPEQKTAVEGIEADFKKVHEAPKDARQKLRGDVADGVAAGKIDGKKTDADIKALGAAVAATTPTVQDAMNRLYKTLDADQRKKLVERLHEEGHEGHEGHEGPKGPEGHDGKHGGGEMAHEGHEGHEGKHGGGRFKKLAEELALTKDQVEKLKKELGSKMKADRAAMKTKMEAGKKHMKEIGESFEGDKFDAKKAGVGSMAPDMVKDVAKNRVGMATTLLGVLTPEQRTKFAEQIRSMPEEDEDEDQGEDMDEPGEPGDAK